MRKKIKKILTFVLCCFIAVPTPIYASEEDYSDKSIYDSATELADAFESVGIDNKLLIELMNSNSQNMARSYNDFWGDDSDLMFDTSVIPVQEISTYSGGFLNGSPAANRTEQRERMEYITDVFYQHYGQAKYASVQGEYMAYLYVSHYTENGQYDHSNPQASLCVSLRG